MLTCPMLMLARVIAMKDIMNGPSSELACSVWPTVYSTDDSVSLLLSLTQHQRGIIEVCVGPIIQF